MNCSTPGFPVHHQLPERIQTHVHQVGDATQLSHPLLSPSPPAFNPSEHEGLFQWVSSSHQVAKHWSFRFSISPSNEYSWLISFRMNWLNLLAVQGTLKSSAAQFEGINSSVLSLFYCSSLTLIHDYWKNHSFHYMDLDVGNLSLVLLPLLNPACATEGLRSHTVEA